METLTERQQFLYDFIEKYQLEYGKSPTIKEMREYCHVSSDNSILKHLKALEEKGYIEKDDTPRGIQLLNRVKERLQGVAEETKLPIVGYIPAGTPNITDEHIESWMSVGSDLAPHAKDSFMLRVIGDSMIEAGIFEGDLVIADRKKQAKNGDIVVALVDGGSTVKRLIKNGGRLYLKAENEAYEDILPEESLEVQGVVTGLVRSYL